MNNYEFISYEQTPNDDLQRGIATILMNDLLIRFRHMQKKDGAGDYFASPSVSIKDSAGNRKYMDGIEIDSRSKQALLMEFIRKNVHQHINRPQPNAPASVFETPKSSDEVPF